MYQFSYNLMTEGFSNLNLDIKSIRKKDRQTKTKLETDRKKEIEGQTKSDTDRQTDRG